MIIEIVEILAVEQQSTALSQLISEKNEIVGVVSGKYTNFDNGELFFHKNLYKEIL